MMSMWMSFSTTQLRSLAAPDTSYTYTHEENLSEHFFTSLSHTYIPITPCIKIYWEENTTKDTYTSFTPNTEEHIPLNFTMRHTIRSTKEKQVIASFYTPVKSCQEKQTANHFYPLFMSQADTQEEHITDWFNIPHVIY